MMTQLVACVRGPCDTSTLSPLLPSTPVSAHLPGLSLLKEADARVVGLLEEEEHQLDLGEVRRLCTQQQATLRLRWQTMQSSAAAQHMPLVVAHTFKYGSTTCNTHAH
jgi:hypothetical protein